jgi:hypothetical protein
MMKRIIVLFIAVCIIAVAALAQSAAPATPTQSTTPQAAAPQSNPPATAPAKARGKHAGNHAALRDVDDPRVKEMITKQHSERKACKTNPSGEGCADMQVRHKGERRALAKQLRKEGKI